MAWRRGVAYSQDLRDRVFAHCDAGEAVGEIAEALCVTVSYVSKVLTRRSQTGELSARPGRGHGTPKLARLSASIQAAVAARPRPGHVPPKLAGLWASSRAEVPAGQDAPLAEVCRRLGKTHQLSASSA